jgi:integrase
MPIYPKGNGAWRVVIHRRGTRRDWVVVGTKIDAEVFEAKRRLELESGAPHLGRNVPRLSEFCTGAYRTHAQNHLKPSTWRNRVYQIANLVEHLGHLRLSEIGIPDVEAYKSLRLKKRIRPSSINDDIKVLMAVLSYARAIGIAVPKLSPKRIPDRAPRRHAEPWSRADVDALFAACDPELLPIVVMLVNTGLRKGEAIALEWGAVDLERRMIRIWPNEEWSPKDGDPREVPIGDALMPWLLQPRASKRWVFPSRTGERFAFWPQRRFDEAVKRAGLTGGPHRCRHTYASHFLHACPDIRLLAKILGHSDTRVTELYAHLLPDHLARARNAVSISPAVGPAVTEAKRRWR